MVRTLPLQGRDPQFENKNLQRVFVNPATIRKSGSAHMEDLISFFQEMGKLKKLKRRGWVIDGVKEPESVSEHSWRTALMVMVLGEERNIDLERAIKMALIHDVPELIAGDIVETDKGKFYVSPGTEILKEKFDKVSERGKIKIEEESAREILPGEYFKLWKEFQEGNTKEARFVKDADRLELALQAYEYECDGNYTSANLRHYYAYCRDKIKDPELLKLLREIEAKRPKE